MKKSKQKSLAGRILAAKAEETLMQQLHVDQKTLQRVGKVLQPKNIKRAAIALVGGSAALSMLGSIGEARMIRRAVGRELKKQLEPVKKQLSTLEEQNKELKKQNDELRRKISELEGHGLHR